MRFLNYNNTNKNFIKNIFTISFSELRCDSKREHIKLTVEIYILFFMFNVLLNIHDNLTIHGKTMISEEFLRSYFHILPGSAKVLSPLSSVHGLV